jgi:mono/diheme cytochrome c family protein
MLYKGMQRQFHPMKINKKYIVLGSVALAVMSLFASCDKLDPNSPGVEYMPDMYRSPSYETNAYTTFLGDSVMTNRQPVKGTIARGYMPYTLTNDSTGYGLAGRTLRDPLPFSADVVEQGKIIYGKFCIHCHGATGMGDGLVAAKLPGPPPAYSVGLKDLPEGQIFHSITYGKNFMGSHASQISVEDRWKLVRYVQTLQGKTIPSATDSTSAKIVAKPGKPVNGKKKSK